MLPAYICITSLPAITEILLPRQLCISRSIRSIYLPYVTPLRALFADMYFLTLLRSTITFSKPRDYRFGIMLIYNRQQDEKLGFVPQADPER
jgi:hypothetical protein